MFFWGVPKPSLALRLGRAIRYNLPKKNREDFHCYPSRKSTTMAIPKINFNFKPKFQFVLLFLYI
jgi:hypothetical protein